jgi:hypothetical protein
MTRNEPENCPLCGSADTVPIVYGLPDPELISIEDVEAGRVVLGSCIVGGGEPLWRCRRCRFEWGALQLED